MKHLKTFELYVFEINEEISEIISQLNQLNVIYELSDNKYKPFKVIYKPINKSDEFYKKFDEIIYLNNLESVVEIKD